jgi:pSer/pThr/pTyr-binding forkhead associated (FHA) protein
MPKLVILNASLAGRSQELAVDKTTIGRVEDNTFPITEPSVSSHHCEVLLRGNDVVVKDLNSTNGTFINGDQVSEAVLKPGQTLRLGQIELRLETEEMASAPTSVSSAAPATTSAASSSKKMDHTIVMQRGISLNELEGARTGGFDTTSKAFSKKDNQTNRWFWIGGIIAAVLIALLMLYAFSQIRR